LEYEQLSIADTKKRYPFIDKTQDLSFAIFGAKDGIINSNAVKNYFRREAKQRGVTFQDRSWVNHIEKIGSHYRIGYLSLDSEDTAKDCLRKPDDPPRSSVKSLECENIIVCCGAWSDKLLGLLGQKPILKPTRRQMCLFSAENFDLSPYGMIVDPSRVYFHPEGGNILSGFVIKEEPAGFNFDYDPKFFENCIWPALYERSTKLERLKHMTGWAGLYSYTPDMSGVLGKVPGHENVFEAHSFTGRGVMQSYGAAVAMSELIVDGKYQSLDASPLCRSRFEDRSKWLTEQLHI